MAKNTIGTRLDRDAVIEAACVAADRDGYEALSIAVVAADLDRHASSLYNHVDGLAGLRRAVTIRSLEELGQRLNRSVLGRGGVTGLRAVADAYRAYAVEHPGRFQAATTWQAQLARDDEMMQAVAPAGEAIHAVMASFDLAEPEVVHATRVFTCALVGFVQSAGTTFAAPPALDETFDRLIDLFVSALTRGEWLGGHGA